MPQICATEISHSPERFRRPIRPVRQGTDLLYTQWDSNPQFSSGPDSFFAGWEDEDEGSLRSNRFGALAEDEVSQLPRPSRRLVLVRAETKFGQTKCGTINIVRVSVKVFRV